VRAGIDRHYLIEYWRTFLLYYLSFELSVGQKEGGSMTLSSARRAAMQCPNCQADNPEINKFCRECGTKLIQVCPQCKSEIQTNDRFCGQCGHNLAVTSATAQLPRSKQENELPATSAESISFIEEAVNPQNLDFSLVSAIYPLTTLSEAYRLNG
jgi:Double zinc ribbon